MTDTLMSMDFPSLGPPSRKTNNKKPYVSPSMQGYQQKMKLAQSSKGICYGSGQNVGRMSLKELLSQNSSNQYQQDTEIPVKYQVPIFQRRYCWTETQWQTLLMDAATSKSLHSLGRLTCTNSTTTTSQLPINNEEEKVAFDDSTSSSSLSSSDHDRSIILDGQQRFTTVTLLLAAIRDTMWKRQQRALLQKKNLHSSFDHDQANRMIEEINQILFPDQDDYQAWLASSSPQLEEGMTLPFAKLIPTYCDRWSYYSAILPRDAKTVSNRLNHHHDSDSSSSTTAFHRPLAAKKYFDAVLSTFSNGEVSNLLQGVYTKLTMLFFPIELAGRTDGTEDLMVVYERLAVRDATLCTPTRSDEYVTMSGLDMIRNALLGAFVDPKQALEFYQSYWLPMERMAATASIVTGGGEQQEEQQQKEEERNMTSMMNAFLDQQRLTAAEEEEEKVEEGTVGGRLYARFQLWQDLYLVTSLHQTTTTQSLSAEDVTRKQGEAMLRFAQGYFEA
mmetsp:Transcript_10626/g.25667  ORF Transcript_10626/g.25667 Transcript_10626/m.25667 type:complete len:503 (-) Transcript_10626:222-1730(-)